MVTIVQCASNDCVISIVWHVVPQSRYKIESDTVFEVVTS